MQLNTILALSDFSTQGEHALERAAMVAANHRAGLRLLYGTDTPNDKFSHPQARLEQRARQLARRHGIDVQALQGSGALGLDLPLHAIHADLLVMDVQRQRSMRNFWSGATVRQLARRLGRPVLVVKQAPQAPYQKMLVAVDLSPASRALVRYAGAFEQHAAVELFHALENACDVPLRATDVSLEMIQACRRDALHQAQGRLLRWTDSFDTRRNRHALAVRRGDPARQTSVQQQASKADLLVVGKSRRPMLMDLLWGGPAWRLAALAGCDVLVVPDHHPATGDGAEGVGHMKYKFVYDAATSAEP